MGDAEILVFGRQSNSLSVWDVLAGHTIGAAVTLEEVMSAASYGETEATVLLARSAEQRRSRPSRRGVLGDPKRRVHFELSVRCLTDFPLTR